MEWIEGQTVKELLMSVKELRKRAQQEELLREEVRKLMGRIGRTIGKMHEVGVVHGDLTTSNFIVRPGTQQSNGIPRHSSHDHMDKLCSADLDVAAGSGSTLENGEVVLIDFGLTTSSIQDEDKAVDLYVLERAFGSTHSEAEDDFREVLKAYGEGSRAARVVLKRLEDVRLRGRKKSMIG